MTPLHLLALYAPDSAEGLHGNTDLAKLLLSHGANVSAIAEPEHLHVTPIMLAGERESVGEDKQPANNSHVNILLTYCLLMLSILQPHPPLHLLPQISPSASVRLFLC